MSQFLIITGALALVGYLYNKSSQATKKRKAAQQKLAEEKERERQSLVTHLTAMLPKAEQANLGLAAHQQYQAGYFTNYARNLWEQEYAPLYKNINGKRFQDIGLDAPKVQTLRKFVDSYTSSKELCKQHNKRYVSGELLKYQEFFNNIEGRALDAQQRESIVTDEDNNIVVAGAGSGKTTTIVGKVNYVIDRYKVKPQEILLISFTNKSAVTLAERIDVPGVEAKTFHKFGKDVITAVEKEQPSIFDEAQFRPLLQRFFNEELQDASYLGKVTLYFTDLLKPYRSQFEFEDQGQYIQYIKDQNCRPYKPVPLNIRGKMTPRMEIVKSMEECRIANFLYFNNVDYEYEFPYEHNTANESYKQYRPDFIIRQGDKVVYLEHFGVSRTGDVPSWFSAGDGLSARDHYQQGMQWKRELHAEHGTTLIESYSYEMSEGILFDNLSKSLNSHGITLSPRPAKEIWQLINSVAQDEVKAVINLIGTFITLMKSNNYTLQQVVSKNKAAGTTDKKRSAVIIDIIAPLYQKYESHLEGRGEIDFSDMINKASGYITEGKLMQSYRYIIIDEFQDISIGRYGLIKALKGQNPACRLFCVGDDWQSIYRFAGSDLTLFKDFSQHFGYSESSKIETTYRFNSPLIELSGSFIEKNPNQAKKKLRGTGKGSTQYGIRYATNDGADDGEILKDIFAELARQPGILGKSILILGRYGFDFDRIKNLKGDFLLNGQDGSVSCTVMGSQGIPIVLKAVFMTVHKAKGLEADIVIVLNCNAGKHGFPSQLSDDPVLNLLLSAADQFENGEERRLFYVAMTRARSQLFLVADAVNKSKFILELETRQKASKTLKCARCKTADMQFKKEGIARNGNGYKFYGCANFIYGCDYIHTVWDNKN